MILADSGRKDFFFCFNQLQGILALRMFLCIDVVLFRSSVGDISVKDCVSKYMAQSLQVCEFYSYWEHYLLDTLFVILFIIFIIFILLQKNSLRVFSLYFKIPK